MKVTDNMLRIINYQQDARSNKLKANHVFCGMAYGIHIYIVYIHIHRVAVLTTLQSTYYIQNTVNATEHRKYYQTCVFFVEVEMVVVENGCADGGQRTAGAWRRPVRTTTRLRCNAIILIVAIIESRSTQPPFLIVSSLHNNKVRVENPHSSQLFLALSNVYYYWCMGCTGIQRVGSMSSSTFMA